jgi:hypothetical protein
MTADRAVYPALIASALLIILATVVGYHDEIDRAVGVGANRTAAQSHRKAASHNRQQMSVRW